MIQEKIIIIDFGSQYTQLIARRVRELNVYSEVHPFFHIPEFSSEVKGFILSGSPFSVNHVNYPKISLSSIRKKFPILGICYGAQILAHSENGIINSSMTREYGNATLNILQENHPLFRGVSQNSQVWMSHADTIQTLPTNFNILASTDSIQNAAFSVNGELTFGIQFHPEVTHTKEGKNIFRNFVQGICKCKCNWTPESFIESVVSELKEKIKNEKVVMALSGGVDSTVAAYLLHQAIGNNLFCVFVDNGLLRKNEFLNVLNSYKELHLNVRGINSKEIFYNRLNHISEPEQKRKIIGNTFIEIFEDEAHKIENVQWLGQGTIYPDVIESVNVSGPSAKIKSHHNVGGLPERMNLKIIEPLRTLFKDEVRKVGKSLQIPDDILMRHPFPGPGLGIRILGDVNIENINILQEADYIFIEGLKNEGLYSNIWQAGAIFVPQKSVGVMGDERTYENMIALRAVKSEDGMTADWYPLPFDFLRNISNEIINKVKGINRVVYDISSKPPATIEWE